MHLPKNRPQTIQRTEVETEDDRLKFLTPTEVEDLTEVGERGLRETFRRCCLGIMYSGSRSDSTKELLEIHEDFDIEIARAKQGVKFVLKNAPKSAFVDGRELKESLQEHLCAVAIDLIYHAKHLGTPRTSEDMTDAVFRILRHARVFEQREPRNSHARSRRELSRVVCWGGHSISNEEYLYTKKVGAQLGERFAELITGCGPGAMRGPFSGAVSAYETRRIQHARKFGFTCPSIITSEPPNSFVDPLITLPDIEKRLEAFIRASLGCVVFAGGPGTAEEIQTVLSILLHEKNNNQQYPVILTGPESARGYFTAIDGFLKKVIGEGALRKPKPKYEIIINDPEGVAQRMMERIEGAKKCRDANDDDRLWYGSLHLPFELQKPFESTHKNMAKLQLHRDQPPYQIAAQMRRLFSAVVYGNVNDQGIQSIEEKGPFVFEGDPSIIKPLDELLRRFVAERRMKIEGKYKPCYTLKKAG